MERILPAIIAIPIIVAYFIGKCVGYRDDINDRF
jgi:hypothetical protein